jgi:glycosyltransferase involved in cell wall biosynthesis
LIFEPPDGGVAEQVMQLALGLGRHGFEVEVAGPLEAIVYPELERAGIPIHRLTLERGYAAPWADARALAGLASLVRRRRPALVHCHSAKAGVLGRLAAAAARLPVVYSPHSFPFIGEFSEARRRLALLTERALEPLTTVLICVCEYERQVARAHGLGDRSRLAVVHNACPPCPPVKPDEELERMRAEGPLAGVVSVLRRQKSVDVFVEAAPLVLDRIPGARLAVVGDGPERTAIEERAAALGLLDDARFRFLPFRAPAARHLRALDLYVLPSAWEALPIGVLEALACGVPQVASDVGGTGEAIDRETGLLVPKHDPRALADAICELLGDEARRKRLAAASVERHARRFGLERMLVGTAAAYREALARA